MDQDILSAKYGGTGGSVHQQYCPEGAWVTGFNYKDGTRTDSLGLICSDGTAFPRTGGTGGGTPQTFTCPGGFTSISTRHGALLDGIMLSCGNTTQTIGGTGGSLDTFNCGQDRYIVGATLYSGTEIDAIQVKCSSRAKCFYHPEHIVAGECEYWCNDNRQQCIDTINNYCRDLSVPGCKAYVARHQGESTFDPLVQNWCSQHLDDPFCACYVPFKADPSIPQWAAEILASNPQCWSSGCNTGAYQPAAIYRKPCPDLQLQSCVQTTQVDNKGQITGNVTLTQATNCAQYHSTTESTTTTGGGSGTSTKTDSSVTPSKTTNTVSGVTPSTPSALGFLYTFKPWQYAVAGGLLVGVLLLLAVIAAGGDQKSSSGVPGGVPRGVAGEVEQQEEETSFSPSSSHHLSNGSQYKSKHNWVEQYDASMLT